MPSFIKHEGGDDGWSDWVNPSRDGYKFACCDCGLVHDMQFAVAEFADDKSMEHTVVDKPRVGVVFRARRNGRSTGQMRRHRAEGGPIHKTNHGGLDGWKEAAIAWSVCASIHERFAKPGSRGKDAFYTTRQADFQRHHEAARALALNEPAPAASGNPATARPDDKTQVSQPGTAGQK
jgi:hypothetical protein